MKKSLLILLSIFLFSCTNNYEVAEDLYIQGVNKKSKFFLKQASLKLDMIQEHHSDYNNANILEMKIDSVKKNWDLNAQLRLKRKNDSISNIKKIEQQQLTALSKAYDDSLKTLDRKYPNLVGRWILDETNYLSTLNSIVRIYKKNGTFYRSMVRNKSGNESTQKLIKKSSTRYDVVGKSDYCIIDSKGELQFLDKEGYLLTCKKTKEIKIVKKKSKDLIIKTAKGNNIFSYRYANELGNPETLQSTNNTYWISYYKDLDITLISLKKTISS